MFQLLEDAAAYPANDGDRLAVPDRLVAWAVGALAGRLSPPRDQRVVVWHSLETLALARNETPDGWSYLGRWHALASLSATATERAGDAAGITRQVIDRGEESLSEKQRFVFKRDVLSLDPGECVRGCDIPWSEKFEAMDNGGLCSWCAKMKESADKDD
jgi:hypothetical protein